MEHRFHALTENNDSTASSLPTLPFSESLLGYQDTFSVALEERKMHKTVTLTVKENVNLSWSRKPVYVPHLRVTSGTGKLAGNRTVSDGPISRLLLSSTMSKT